MRNRDAHDSCRTGLVQRLLDYPWSSYPAYAYGRRCPDWLKTDLILSQFGPDSTGRKAYREKVQQCGDEDKSVWEEVKNGMVFGSQAFIDRLKKKYLDPEHLADAPDRQQFIGGRKLGEIIETAPAHLKGDIQRWKSARRISKADTLKRDMLVYHLWRSGRFSNSEIGNQIGLSISSISRRAGKFQALLDRDKKVQITYDKFKSIIKF
jgi:hypothetical protein